jgi:hypothetical protein
MKKKETIYALSSGINTAISVRKSISVDSKD